MTYAETINAARTAFKAAREELLKAEALLDMAIDMAPDNHCDGAFMDIDILCFNNAAREAGNAREHIYDALGELR